MQQNHPLVSINLLSYNAQEYINGCLNSVFNQTYPRLEILIIDNASTDKTRDYLKKLPKRPNLKIIFNSENVGFAAGHNQAIKRSRGEFILCLNQDVILDKDFVYRTIELFKKNDRLAAVQGKLLRWNTSNPTLRSFTDYEVSYIIDTVGLKILKNRRVINRGQGKVDQDGFKKVEEIFGADGAAPVYRRKALEDVKIFLAGKSEYFDEDFFCYKEDVDLAWRLQLYRWKAMYQPKALAWHARTAGDSAETGYLNIIKERSKISKFAKYFAFKNQRLMQFKNEQPLLIIKHSLWFLPKEMASWAYVIIFERYTLKAIKDLFKQMPSAWRKRKIVMSGKRASSSEMNRWFK